MSKKWRPNNWEEIRQIPSGEKYFDRKQYFEAGADAILDALIKETGRFTLDHKTPYISKDEPFSGVILEPGWEVFILNKEAKDGK